MNTAGWVAVCVACLSVGGFVGAFAMGVSAGATRHRLIRERDEARRSLRSYQGCADEAYQDGAE